MELLIIICIFLVSLTAWFWLSWYHRGATARKLERQLQHQALQLKQAALINHRVRMERDDMRSKFLRAANYVERLEKQLETTVAPTFSPDDLKTLINLCHPDRHGGKESAHRMTQILLKMR